MPKRGWRIANGLDYGIPTAAATSRVVIRSVAPILPVCPGTASGLLRRPASAKLLLCSRTVPVLAPPFRSPQKSSFLPGEPRPLAFRVPETNGQNRRNVCTSIESPLSVLSAATPKERPATQPTSRSFHSPPRRPGRTMPDPGNRAPSGIGASPSGNSPISLAPSPKALM